MQSVFVADGDAREAIAITRSLGKKGLKVIVGSAEKTSPAFFSKYTARKFIYTNPIDDEKKFLHEICQFVSSWKPAVLFPIRDNTTLLFSKYKSKFEAHTKIPLVSYTTLKIAYDKLETIKAAVQHNIPCPTTWFEVDNSKKIEYPVVIKPRFSSGSRGIVHVSSRDELKLKYSFVERYYSKPIVQEYIPSDGSYGVSMLYNKGVLKARFTHKRLREYPVTGGPSTLRVSVSYPEIEHYAKKLLDALNWHGVAMVEFKVDRRDKKPKLMEINPRFWGSLPLAIASGVDFPYLLFKMTVEGDVKPIFNYRLNVKCRWLFGDLLWYLTSGNKLANLPVFLKFKGMNYDIISFDDIGPFIGTLFDAISIMCTPARRTAAIRR